MKIALIPNPSARAFREDRKLMEQLWRLVQGRGIVTEPESVDDLPDAIADAREFGVDTVVIAGGDGTTGRVTSALLADWPHDALPKLYVLHAGTMNTISKSMGSRGTPVEQLQALVDGKATLRTRRTPVQVGEDRWGWLFGLGLIANYIEAYESGDEPPSPRKAATTLARAVLSSFTGGEAAERFFARLGAEIVIDGNPWPIRDWLLLSAAGVDDLGLRFRPHTEVLEHPGKLHVLGIGSAPSRFALDLLPIRFGMLPKRSLVFDAPATEIVIRATRPLKYNLDGDLGDAGPVLRLKAGPTLEFLLPPNAKPPANRLGP